MLKSTWGVECDSHALERLTGRDSGYRFGDGAGARRDAVENWFSGSATPGADAISNSGFRPGCGGEE